MSSVHRKNHLSRHQQAMERHLPGVYAFYPQTWVLPADYALLCAHVRDATARDTRQAWIAKPADKCQGIGIFIVLGLQDLPRDGEKLVVQKYIRK